MDSKLNCIYDNDMDRRKELDLAKGMCILLMIYCHIIKEPVSFKIIYTFHMPAFFVISGILRRKRDIKYVLISNFKKLIIPWIVINLWFFISKVYIVKNMSLYDIYFNIVNMGGVRCYLVFDNNVFCKGNI